MHTVSMLDLKTEFGLYGDELMTTVRSVLESQLFIGGPAVGRLEETLAKTLTANHAIAVSNGSDAILLALMALCVGPGDEVIVPSFTFFATAGAVARVGAKPVFVDIEPKTFNLSPEAVRKAITPKTKAIMPVHLYGQCAAMDDILALAEAHKIPVVEDAAQAIGALYKDRYACTLGKIAAISFYPTKNLGGVGEGGMVMTNDDRLATIVRQLRNHGETERYVHGLIGGNFRLDTMKASMLLVKLAYWPDMQINRLRNAAQYDDLLRGLPIELPYRCSNSTHVFHQYTIRTSKRDALKQYLADHGVGTAVYYPIPLHMQKCFSHLGYQPGDLPESERAAAEVLSLPIHPMLSEQDVTHVATSIRRFFEG